MVAKLSGLSHRSSIHSVIINGNSDWVPTIPRPVLGSPAMRTPGQFRGFGREAIDCHRATLLVRAGNSPLDFHIQLRNGRNPRRIGCIAGQTRVVRRGGTLTP
jgi:hypothetical protein